MKVTLVWHGTEEVSESGNAMLSILTPTEQDEARLAEGEPVMMLDEFGIPAGTQAVTIIIGRDGSA